MHVYMHVRLVYMYLNMHVLVQVNIHCRYVGLVGAHLLKKGTTCISTCILFVDMHVEIVDMHVGLVGAHLLKKGTTYISTCILFVGMYFEIVDMHFWVHLLKKCLTCILFVDIYVLCWNCWSAFTEKRHSNMHVNCLTCTLPSCILKCFRWTLPKYVSQEISSENGINKTQCLSEFKWLFCLDYESKR